MDPHDFQTDVRGGILAGMHFYPVPHFNSSLLSDAVLVNHVCGIKDCTS